MKFPKPSIEDQIVSFIHKWGRAHPLRRSEFINELRALLEVYARAALVHGNLPDTEHEHKERS